MTNDVTGPQGLRPQDFDAIRDAVMETPRGRWFLNEYASRLRSSETAGLLDSMRRLENALASNHDELMARLASALKNEAPAPAPVQPQADLAPKHMKFFKQDEEIFAPAPQAKIAVVETVAPRPEPKPEVPKGARVVIKRAEQVTVEAELPPVAAPAEPFAEAKSAVEEPAAPPAPAPSAAEAPPAPQAEATPKRRIVIIRHKPGEEIDVPLQNEIAQAS